MPLTLNPPPKFFLNDAIGDPAVGWKIYTYEPGTAVLKSTYTTSAGTVANTNPVILNARGEADIWWDGSYKVVIKDADDNTIYTSDNYTAANITSSGFTDNATTEQITISDDETVFANRVNFSKGADIASASTLILGSDGNYFDVTGTTAITAIATVGVGTVVKLHFDAALTFTHNATTLILPGGANITTAAGDEAEVIEYSTGNWRVLDYVKADGTPLAISVSPTDLESGQYGGDYIKLSDTKTAGTDGGTFTSGAWYTRTLNTEDVDTGNHCSLTSNQFTLDAGTYRIKARSAAYDVNAHIAKLYNITDAADEIIGTNELCVAVQTSSDVSGFLP